MNPGSKETLLAMRYVFLLSLAAILAPQAGLPASPANEAFYLGGTLKSIPVNTRGVLNLEDSANLQFEYGKDTYQVAYSRIRSVNFTTPESSRMRTVAHLPVPRLPALHHEQIFDLSFQDDKGGIGTASFRLVGKGLSHAEFTLTERMDAAKHPSQRAGAG